MAEACGDQDRSPCVLARCCKECSREPDLDATAAAMTAVRVVECGCIHGPRVVEHTLRGLVEAGLLQADQQIVSIMYEYLPRGYPVPTCDRDEVLREAMPVLEAGGVLSRGRFGAFKYEVSNQDHCCMQGVEAADRLLVGAEERTLSAPSLVNAPGKREGPDLADSELL